MDKNDSPPLIDPLADFVGQVESILANVRIALEGLSSIDVDTKDVNAQSLEIILEKSFSLEEQVSSLRGVFVSCEQEEISPYEKSEVVRAISLLKRANIGIQNTPRLVKKALGIPDPDREQAELQMQLQAMGVIHGGHH